MKPLFLNSLAALCFTGVLIAKADAQSPDPRAELMREFESMKATSAADAQKILLEKLPEIGILATPENLVFRALYNYAKGYTGDALIFRKPDWPFKLGCQIAEIGADIPKKLQSGTLTHWLVFRCIYSLDASEVKRLLGPPSSTYESGGKEFWRYKKAAKNPVTEKTDDLLIEFRSNSTSWQNSMRAYAAEIGGIKRTLSPSDSVAEAFSR